MENQHRKISGYRELTQQEIDLMNLAKQLEVEVLKFQREIVRHLDIQNDAGPEERERLKKAEAYRWHAIARTDIETGFMALVRSIAQPQPKE